jgi:hypothetical protein
MREMERGASFSLGGDLGLRGGAGRCLAPAFGPPPP